MNDDERSSQVSALFDGELTATEGELVLRRVLKDAELAQAWSRYAAIGAVVRNEPLARASRGAPDLAARVMASLDGEMAHVAPAMPAPASTGRAGRSWFTRGAAGAAIAAGVAALSLVVVRTQAPTPAGDPASLVAAAVTPAAATDSSSPTGPAPAASVPAVGGTAGRQVAARAPAAEARVDLSPVGQAVSAPLVGYVVAHSEYATPAVRFSPLSTVMMVDVDPTVGTVETTEAEARARR